MQCTVQFTVNAVQPVPRAELHCIALQCTAQYSRCLELNCSHKWAPESAALRGNSLLPTYDHGGDDHDDHDDDHADGVK